MSVDLVIVAALAIVTIASLLLKTHVPLLIIFASSSFLIAEIFSEPVAEQLLLWFGRFTDIDTLMLAVGLAIYILPVVAIAYHFRHTQHGKFFAYLAPAILLSAFIFTLGIGLVPEVYLVQLEANSHLTVVALQYQGAIWLAAIGMALLEFMTREARMSGGTRRRKKRSKH